MWCHSPLPEPRSKGHRRREFCNNACKQKHYLWYRQTKHEAIELAEPFWRTQYLVLVEHYKWLETMVQARLKEMEQLEAEKQYYQKYAQAIQIDYVARLRAIGMSEDQVKEFDQFWENMQIPPWLKPTEEP